MLYLNPGAQNGKNNSCSVKWLPIIYLNKEGVSN